MTDQKQHWAKTAKLGNLASVIDPKDTLGYKNRYIAYVRDRALRKIISSNLFTLLDFGCGSGNLSHSMAEESKHITGIDISFDLLQLAVKQNKPNFSSFVQYDGHQIPLKNDSFDYATTYVVLNHIIDNNQLASVLKEIYRVLKPKGALICIEQTRRRGQLTDNNLKNQRSVEEFTHLFEQENFCVKNIEYIRRARFPLIYAIRYGLIKDKHFETIAQWDQAYSSIFNKPLYSYVDTLFVLTKSANDT